MLGICAVPSGANVVSCKVVAAEPRKAKMIAGGLRDSDVSDRSHHIVLHGSLKLGLQGCKQKFVVITLGKSGCSDSECGQRGGKRNE